ncbi:hypothetical protein [Niveispirillum fermenti]|uniref:hypothetical protein n=1 Tax=Niveispirillum fermenti TaxID=1233113 RepID=UPI003A83AF64
MKQHRIYSADPVSDETARRLRMGRNKVRLAGLVAAGFGALAVPMWIVAATFGYFKLDQDFGPTVFPRLMSEQEAQTIQQQRIEENRAAAGQPSPTD